VFTCTHLRGAGPRDAARPQKVSLSCATETIPDATRPIWEASLRPADPRGSPWRAHPYPHPDPDVGLPRGDIRGGNLADLFGDPQQRSPMILTHPRPQVCLGEIEDGEAYRKLGCQHAFHTECIDTWLTGERNSTDCDTDMCPNCRAPVKVAAVDEGDEDESAMEEEEEAAPEAAHAIPEEDAPMEVTIPPAPETQPRTSWRRPSPHPRGEPCLCRGGRRSRTRTSSPSRPITCSP
jgi:hypothetical protein